MLVTCIHADRCPGCALIDRPYAAQLLEKRAIVSRAIARHAPLASVAVDEVAGATELVEYRVRAKLAASGARLGAFLPESHEVLDIPGCRVHRPVIARALAALRELFAARPVPGLGAVDLRSALGPRGERVLVTLVVDRDHPAAAAEREAVGGAVLEACPEIAGVAWSTGMAGGPQLLGSDPEHVAGARDLEDIIAGTTLIATPGTFVQAHRAQAARVVDEVAAGLARELGSLEAKRVLDLYGGSGAIGLALASRGARVTIVESHRRAADGAARAGAAFGARVRVVNADVARFAADAGGPSWDAAVVNPPRRGLAPEVRGWLGSLGAPVAYVSCNPETLARDLAHFAVLGLAARRLAPVDMIPLTEEVESVALLVPAPLPAPRILHQDAELVVVDKPAHEPTTPQGEHPGSLLGRVQALPGCERAAPIHRLDVGTSGVCIFAKTPRAAARWGRALADSEKRYVALARGVWSARGVVNRKLPGERTGRVLTTRYRRLEVTLGQSLLDVVPESGKKHQIRRHLAGIGHPVVGDARYGHAPTNRHFAERHGLDRAFLHCARIEIAIPGDRAHVFEAPLAGDLESVLSRAR